MTVCPERFFKTLKREEVYLHDDRTFEEVEANLSRYSRACQQQSWRGLAYLGERGWAHLDSNQGPTPYEGAALTAEL